MQLKLSFLILKNLDSDGGVEVAAKIRILDNKNKVKNVVCSGDSSCPEILEYQNYGFDAAMDKALNRKGIEQLLNQLSDD